VIREDDAQGISLFFLRRFSGSRAAMAAIDIIKQPTSPDFRPRQSSQNSQPGAIVGFLHSPPLNKCSSLSAHRARGEQDERKGSLDMTPSLPRLRLAPHQLRHRIPMCAALLAVCVLTVLSHPASAQTTVNSSTTQLPSSAGAGSGSATSMWGVGSGGGTSASSSMADSATAHETLGQSAALVNSAKRGFLYSSGTSIILESIGSQSIVSTSIYGDNNVADINANQTSVNNGNVNAVGAISLSGNATTNTTSPATTTATTGASVPTGKSGGSSPGNATAGSSAPAGGTSGNTTTASTTIGKPPIAEHP
jgi:hypothetical protein